MTTIIQTSHTPSSSSTNVITPAKGPQSNDLSVWQRMTAASIGSLATGLVVTPLEVVKVKMQAGQTRRKCSGLKCPSMSAHRVPVVEKIIQICSNECKENGLRCQRQGTLTRHMVLPHLSATRSFVPTTPYIPHGCWIHSLSHSTKTQITRDYVLCGNGISDIKIHRSHKFLGACCNASINIETSFWGIVRSILKNDGIPGIYAGLEPTLIKSIPSNVLYFLAYETLKEQDLLRNNFGSITPLVSGGFARIVASSTSAPFELLRTRMAINQSTMGETIKSLSKGGSLETSRELFRGLGVTLARDVPFSAMYWFLFEQMAARRKSDTPLDAFISGATAGGISSIITHPLDVIKTRQQTRDTSAGEITFRQAIREIRDESGYRGLFAGVAPRLMKVAVACGIMISTYRGVKELVKREYEH